MGVFKGLMKKNSIYIEIILNKKEQIRKKEGGIRKKKQGRTNE
jgi:hypothetical protein